MREKGKPPRLSHFDFYLWKDGFESGRPVFICEGLIISDVRAPRARGIRSFVIAESGALATLSGDVEKATHSPMAFGQNCTHLVKQPGDLNANSQHLLRVTGMKGNDFTARVWVMKCRRCGEIYGCNGTDALAEKVPELPGWSERFGYPGGLSLPRFGGHPEGRWVK